MEITLRVPAIIQGVLKIFRLSNREIYIVGGVVRDIMLDRSLYDWDFTTNATPEEMLKLFPDAFYDNKYGTVGIPNGEDRPLEITTFRAEHGFTDGRHPDNVTWGKSLSEDLQRRDFTINAMALKPVKTNVFEVIDLFGGTDDIKNGVIKTVGNPEERFAEDALRMMRAVRIAAQLRFAIDEETFLAVKKMAVNISQISAERVRDELLKIFASEFPADGYQLLRNCGLGEIILPEMEKTFGVEQKSPGRHHIYDVGTHSMEALRMCPSADPVTRLATLIHDAGKVRTQRIYPDKRITFYNHEMESEKIAIEIANRLRFSNEQKDKFVRLVRWHQFTVDENQTDSAIRRFLKNTGLANVNEMLALRTGDRLGGGARETSWRLEEFKKRLTEVQKQPFSIPDLKISGYEVMKIKNVPSGPFVGKYLQMLFEEVTEKGLANDKEVLIKRLKELEVK